MKNNGDMEIKAVAKFHGLHERARAIGIKLSIKEGLFCISCGIDDALHNTLSEVDMFLTWCELMNEDSRIVATDGVDGDDREDYGVSKSGVLTTGDDGVSQKGVVMSDMIPPLRDIRKGLRVVDVELF